MRLLVDLHCFDFDTSEGINTYLEGLYREAVELRRDIEFLFAARNVEKIKGIFGEHPNVTYVALTAKNKFYRLLFEFPQLIKRHRVDYAHFQYTSPLIKSCKTIVTLHDILFLDYPQYFPTSYRVVKGILFRISAARADLLLTVSDYSRERIAHHYGIEQESIVVTPNAVDDVFRRVDSAEAQRFISDQGVGRYILYVSRFEPRKNHLRLLKSYCQLRLWERGYSLVLIGKKTIAIEEFDEYLSSLTDEVRSHIYIHNQVPFKELLLWYNQASLFVYPSIAEGFGIPPLEAAMAGVSCICSNKTAMQEFDFFGEDLIDTDDEKLLNKRIINMLEQAETPQAPQQKEQTRAKIAAKYNWRSSAEALLSRLKK